MLYNTMCKFSLSILEYVLFFTYIMPMDEGEAFYFLYIYYPS